MTSPSRNTAPEVDPLASYDKTPAVSFTTDGGFPQNIERTFVATGYVDTVQAKDEQGKPQVYEDTGKPVLKAVIPVQDEDGNDLNIWMKKNNVPGGLFRGFREAQAELGSRIGPGTRLTLSWWNDTTKPKKLGNHPKAYTVKAVAGDAPPPASDPLAEVPSTPSVSPVSDNTPPF